MEEKRSLVEPEGVNAGSAEQSEDRDVPPPPGSTLGGGRPEGAAEQPGSDLDDQSGGGEMVGAGGSGEDGTSGQDEGSMD